MNMSNKKIHPTRLRLLETACELIGKHSIDDITVDMVLAESGIVKGSLYYHYEDFNDLIETALAEMFAAGVNASVAVISAHVDTAADRDAFLEGFREILADTQSDARRSIRFRRARLLALAEHRPRLMARIAAEQARMTGAFTAMFVTCQERGWFNSDFDPKAAATFIQAYTFGKLIDEVSNDPADPDGWSDIVMKVLYRIFA